MFVAIRNLLTHQIAVFALVVAAMMLVMACGAPVSGGFVVDDYEKSEQPEIIYLALDDRSPYGDADNESAEDPDGQERECKLLPFRKQSTTDPHGKHHYYSDKITSAFWSLCKDYANFGDPPLVINSLPDEAAEVLGIEVPKLLPSN